MLKLFPKLMLVLGVGLTGAACVDDGNAAPRGYYQPTAAAYGNPYNSGYAPAPAYGYAPAPAYGYAPSYGYSQPAPAYGYANQQRYTTVTVTNRGQNGYRDDVVQQQVACGSQYYDGYRTRTAPRC
jgi:hypothetical protein